MSKGDKFGRTPLILSAWNGHASILSLLLKYKANIEAIDTSGNSSLHYAAAYGFIECLEYLLENGANPNVENLWKITPLQIALLKRHDMCVKILLSKSWININSVDDEGRTLLGLSIQNLSKRNIETVFKLITDHNPDPNLQDALGNSPLHIALHKIIEKKKWKKDYYSELQVSKLLIERGANSGI